MHDHNENQASSIIEWDNLICPLFVIYMKIKRKEERYKRDEIEIFIFIIYLRKV